MSDPDRIRIVAATEGELAAVAELARVIWRRHYPGMISAAQIEYMLERGYSRAALLRFVTEAGAGLALARLDARLAGFAAWYRADDPDEIKLDKLYVHQDFHRQGVGQRLIDATADAAQAQRRPTIILNVNKNNAQAIRAYARSGFVIREAVIVDIGGGFVMDDYIMAKRLRS